MTTLGEQRVTRGQTAAAPPRGPEPGSGGYAGQVLSRRSVVDYALQRRALLADVHAGRVGLIQACDASPYLLRAAKYHGEPTQASCPICRKERLTRVHYIYGERLGTLSGQAKTERELKVMDGRASEFSVYEVEVCRSCSWNHLIASYVLGGERAGTVGERTGRAARN
ncbi:MAG: DUF5318 family protein [Geodermatophilaceae bacterium]